MDAERHDRPLRTLLNDLSEQTGRLVQGEITLARAELGERITQLALGVGFLVAAIIVAFVALIIVLMGLSQLLAEFMPEVLALWLGYLIVGGVALLAGLFLLKLGLSNLRSAGQLMDRTARSVHQNLQVVKRSGR
ncbi:MAG: phage holin family protein [Geminicoccaceae bacterium]